MSTLGPRPHPPTAPRVRPARRQRDQDRPPPPGRAGRRRRHPARAAGDLRQHSGHDPPRPAALGGISFFNLYVPTLLVFVLIAVGLVTLPQQLSAYRRAGRAAPALDHAGSPSWLLAAQTDRQPDPGRDRDHDSPRRRRQRVRPGAPADASAGTSWRSSRSSSPVAATLGLGLVRRRCGRQPADRRGATRRCSSIRWRSSPACTSRSRRSTPQVVHDIAKALPTGAGFNALHASFLGHSPGVEPLLVLAVWAVGSAWPPPVCFAGNEPGGARIEICTTRSSGTAGPCVAPRTICNVCTTSCAATANAVCPR